MGRIGRGWDGSKRDRVLVSPPGGRGGGTPTDRTRSDSSRSRVGKFPTPHWIRTIPVVSIRVNPPTCSGSRYLGSSLHGEH